MANGSKQLVGKASEFRVISNLMYTYGAFMGCFRTDKSIAVPSFVALCFQTHLYRTIIDVILTGSSINNLNTSNIESIEFQFPNLPEQAQISNTIHDLTKEVDKLEQNISKLKLQKQGMMQALLTGRIRLT
jgi:type I restriction enzyme S subunit